MNNVYDLCYHCESCGAAIVLIKTAEGLMPCNATPVYYIEKPRSGSKKIITPNGEVLSCEYTVHIGQQEQVLYPIVQPATSQTISKVSKKARN